ncbi:MAG: hypothetical protein F2520_03285 [Actinobacteria bacterium]|uniref:Unannotated protein n=1 Tax=freshwater metagenome TaxID=449393 RepID=A0A6J5Y9R7_9ZZZZ|nr:hypothetical protein [Actinomycetota bacterium]MTA77268.1 hypothetical protein [Actinomycetota bacterium]
MTRSGRAILIAFVAWTAFVWISRISNTLRSTTESTGGKVFSTVLSILMLALAAAVVVALVRSWSTPMSSTSLVSLRAAAIVTVVVWLVRVPQIVFLDDDPTHGAPFKIVHAVLGLISIALAAGLWKVADGNAGRAARSVAVDPARAGR